MAWKLWRPLQWAENFLIAVFIASPFVASAAANGEPFPITGEQLEFPLPEGWKLAWMSGKGGGGGYLSEYIPQTEGIHSWREGYLAVERLEYPSTEALKELEKYKIRLSDFALHQFLKKAKEICGGQHTNMAQRTNIFNGVYFAVGGGYCDRYGPAAPFGEGSFVAFAEGKNFWFRIQYGWRPKTLQEQGNNLPWRISPKKATDYLEAIKAATLCGGVEEPVCRNSPVYAH